MGAVRKGSAHFVPSPLGEGGAKRRMRGGVYRDRPFTGYPVAFVHTYQTQQDFFAEKVK